MSEAAARQPAHEPNASLADWIAVGAGSLGALMASLDISITNSALPQIQGEIGASGTEGTWIATGYLIAEVVMIPLTAWLTRVFGLRTFLLSCATLFTLFSIQCGLAHSLPEMIIGRIGQGFTGGALIPTAQTIVATRLPRRQMPIGMTMFGLIVLLGPLVGPVVGGWLTENISWSWCFFLNVPVYFALASLLLLGLPHTKSNFGLLRRADWFGIFGMTAGLSCLTTVLEEGQRERWFESSLITGLSIVSGVGFVVLLLSQMFAKEPVIKLRLLLNRSYASVILIVLVVGSVLYGVLYILPQFLSNVAGYNAFQAGQILLISGVPAFMMMPILPQLLGRVNMKMMITGGLICLAWSAFLDTHLTAESAGGDFIASQLLRGVGQIMAMMPLNQASVGAVAREDAGDAAGLYNMARNLGGSIGLALLGLFIDRRVEAHGDMIREAVTGNSLLAQSRIAGSAANFAASGGGDLAYGRMQALKQLAAQIDLQALVITYSECFWMLGVALLASISLVFLLRTPRRGGPTAMH
ncbi:MDR family MFS transporter [Caulobacter sp. S45]|uniref:MDR family MFS transporter n=1 Tax=Caulobacter sp. S45 TaxID=1641861 RepID=UPI00131D9A2D|nr:MDR family MFS transporter [Caulobacter sp. S45]